MDTQKQEWGCITLMIPIFLVFGAAFGWSVGSRYGILVGLVGGIGGAIFGIPLLGVVLMAALGVAYLIDLLIGGDNRV